MPSSTSPIIYLDACVMLEYINAEDASKVSHIEGVLRDESLKLVTSIISIVEVAKGKVEQDGKALDPSTESQIKRLWDVGSPIELVEFYELIAEDAKELIRKAVPLGYSLKPADAIHLATADRMGVSEFYTYDNLSRFSALTKGKFPILAPVSKWPVLIPGSI